MKIRYSSSLRYPIFSGVSFTFDSTMKTPFFRRVKRAEGVGVQYQGTFFFLLKWWKKFIRISNGKFGEPSQVVQKCLWKLLVVDCLFKWIDSPKKPPSL